MKIVDRITNEFQAAPIGTIGAICGILSLPVGGGIAITFDGVTALPLTLKFGSSLLLAFSMAFVLSFLTGRHASKQSATAIVVHVVMTIVYATVANFFFWINFPQRNSSGGFGNLIMLLTAILLASSYQVMYFERKYGDGFSEEIIKYEFFTAMALVFVSSLIIPIQIYIPVF